MATISKSTRVRRPPGGGGGGGGVMGPSRRVNTNTPPPSSSPESMKYPPSCKGVSEEMNVDELIRRLKVLATAFQGMSQEDKALADYIPLCLHLAEDGFMNHGSRDVRLLLACCLADILRIYAPNAPYKDSEQVKMIFMFLISQLEGLKDPKDPAFSRYFYLLENLAYVKSFNMCFDLEESQGIFCKLFELIFKVVNDEHSEKVKSFMLDVLAPVVNECDGVSNELLNTILINIVEPIKTSRKNSYHLAKALIIKCSDTLEACIQQLFNQVLVCGREDLFISGKVYELVYELNHICPSVVAAVIPQLEYKLKSPEETERRGSVAILASIFSEKGSTLAIECPPLWQTFLGRFNDISSAIRIKCVQYSMHFLLNHPELKVDIVDALKERRHDSEENVRFEVVKSIVATANKDFSIVSESEELLNFVKERTLDKKFKIRKEALQGLAMIYKKHMEVEEVPEATLVAIKWIKNKIFHAYYMDSIDDRICVEKLLNTCLVPFQLDSEERMRKLMYLYGSLDENASRVFVEIQKNLLVIRRHITQLLVCIKKCDSNSNPDNDQQFNVKITVLTKFLPNQVKASEFLCKFGVDLRNDRNLMGMMERIVNPNTDCKSIVEAVNQVLKKLGAPVMTNLYYNTVKALLERMSSVLIDKEAIRHLLTIIQREASGEDRDPQLALFGMRRHDVVERGLGLLSVLAFVFPTHFSTQPTMENLIKLLEFVDEDLKPTVLKSLTFIGKARPIGSQPYASLMGPLEEQCHAIFSNGTPKEGKEAVRCLFTNITESKRFLTFQTTMDLVKENLDPESPNYRSAIVVLGLIAFTMPNDFKAEIKSIVAGKIVKDLLVKPPRTENEKSGDPDDEWCEEEELPEITRCMMAGMKALVRWLTGLQNDGKAAVKTFNMLTAFIETGGGFIQVSVPFSNAEKSWLRLTAGKCMLKICEQKGVGDQFTPAQFCSLAQLMNDEVDQVRAQFAAKLQRGLNRGFPHRCLPLDFMGFYSLTGYIIDHKYKSSVKSYVASAVTKRREYIKHLAMTVNEKSGDQIPHMMPDYMLVFAVPILTHNVRFTDHRDPTQLAQIRECLWFILEPLILKNDGYSFGFYKTLIETMKNHLDAQMPDDDESNFKMYAICDIALGLILQRSPNFEMKNYAYEPRIPPMYFKRHPDVNFFNSQSYLPLDMQFGAPKKAGGLTVSVVAENSKTKRKARKEQEQGQVDEFGNVSIDAQPMNAKETCLEIPEITDEDESHGRSNKVRRMKRNNRPNSRARSQSSKNSVNDDTPCSDPEEHRQVEDSSENLECSPEPLRPKPRVIKNKNPAKERETVKNQRQAENSLQQGELGRGRKPRLVEKETQPEKHGLRKETDRIPPPREISPESLPPVAPKNQPKPTKGRVAGKRPGQTQNQDPPQQAGPVKKSRPVEEKQPAQKVGLRKAAVRVPSSPSSPKRPVVVQKNAQSVKQTRARASSSAVIPQEARKRKRAARSPPEEQPEDRARKSARLASKK